MDETQDVILEVNGLSKVYGEVDSSAVVDMLQEGLTKDEIRERTGAVVGVRDASFKVKRGEFFVMMGLSGSGKSTLARCLIRLIEPTVGEIIIDGQDVAGLPQKELRQVRREKLAMVFQHYGLLPHKTVFENVEYGLKTRKIDQAERKARAMKAIQQVGLDGWEDSRPGSLSGGMQQRVGIARALAHGPTILLMDEPFSGLDPLIRRNMQDEFATLRAEEGITTIFVTHDLDEALKLGDRIAIMRAGEIIQIATPAELVTNPADDYVERFVEGASPARFMTADSLMEMPELTVSEFDSIETVKAALSAHNSHTAFVVDEREHLKGVVNWWAIAGQTRGNLAEHIRKAVTTRPQTRLEDLVPLAAQTDHPIAIVNDSQQLIGAVSRVDLLQTLADDLEEDELGVSSSSSASEEPEFEVAEDEMAEAMRPAMGD